MPQKRVPGESGARVAVGAKRPPDAVPPDVCASVAKPKAEADRQYIVYDKGYDRDDIDGRWFSVDLDTVVARELWR